MFIRDRQQSFKSAQLVLRIVDLQLGQRQRLARQELLYLFAVIVINVIIAECVDKLADFKISHVRDQMSQQRVRADVERHAEKRIGGALVELAVKHAAVLDFELKERVAGRKIDVVRLSRVPSSHD